MEYTILILLLPLLSFLVLGLGGRRHICHTDALQLYMAAVYADTQH